MVDAHINPEVRRILTWLPFRVAKRRHGSEWQSGWLSEPWRDQAATRRCQQPWLRGFLKVCWNLLNYLIFIPTGSLSHLPLKHLRGGWTQRKFHNSIIKSAEIIQASPCCKVAKRRDGSEWTSGGRSEPERDRAAARRCRPWRRRG